MWIVPAVDIHSCKESMAQLKMNPSLKAVSKNVLGDRRKLTHVYDGLGESRS